MESKQDENIIKKLMQDALTDEERLQIESSPEVVHYMKGQWDKSAERPIGFSKIENSIWRKIEKEVFYDRKSTYVRFYKIYSVAATILLLIGVLGIGYFWNAGRNVTSYLVVTSGIQNMQEVNLPDGTIVQLGPGSQLTYPEKFLGNTREVKLRGQAFFDVMKNHNQPFIVQSLGMSIEAVGTAFEVFDYEIETKPEVILLNGKVKIGIDDEKTENTTYYMLDPDERLQLDRRSGEVHKFKVDASKYSAWRNQRILSFENEKLSMIIPRLEKWYGRQVICEKDLAEKYRFTFKVHDESLERIIFLVESTSPLKGEKMENGNYMITQK